MDIAIVTGAGSGLGLAISRKLIELGLRVYGLGGSYTDTGFGHDFFVPVHCNLADMTEVWEKVNEIIEREGDIYVLVNNAKLYPQKDFVESTVEELDAVLRVNLLCPLVLTRMAMPSLVRLGGFVINIVPNRPENTRGGPIGAATAGGLRWMSEQLFEELRDMGVKVTSVFPQANRWRPSEAGPAPKQKPQSAIDLESVADAVGSLVLNRDNNVVTELVIRPQRTVEKPVPPPLNVPYPKPKPLPKVAREEEERETMAETRAEIRKHEQEERRKRIESFEQEISGGRQDLDDEPASDFEDEDDVRDRREDVDDSRERREDVGDSRERREDDSQDDGRRRRRRRGRRGGRNRERDASEARPAESRSGEESQAQGEERGPRQDDERERGEDRGPRRSDDREPIDDRGPRHPDDRRRGGDRGPRRSADRGRGQDRGPRGSDEQPRGEDRGPQRSEDQARDEERGPRRPDDRGPIDDRGPRHPDDRRGRRRGDRGPRRGEDRGPLDERGDRRQRQLDERQPQREQEAERGAERPLPPAQKQAEPVKQGPADQISKQSQQAPADARDGRPRRRGRRNRRPAVLETPGLLAEAQAKAAARTPEHPPSAKPDTTPVKERAPARAKRSAPKKDAPSHPEAKPAQPKAEQAAKTPAKKVAAKKTAAKKTAAKSAAKKTPAKKAAVKKTAAKKTARKTAAKKTTGEGAAG